MGGEADRLRPLPLDAERVVALVAEGGELLRLRLQPKAARPGSGLPVLPQETAVALLGLLAREGRG